MKKTASILFVSILALMGACIVGFDSASASAASTCHLYAAQPNASNDAQVGRVGCANKLWGTGQIKKNIPNWPDYVAGQKSFNAGVATVYGSCKRGEGKYYSQFSSSTGAYVRSAESTTCR